MYDCPHCDFRVSQFEMRCPKCGGDLKMLALFQQLPDVQFNSALRAAQQGDWATSTMLLGAVLAARERDAEAWLLLGLIYARRGLWAPARECWSTVLMLRPGEPRAKEALATVRQLTQST